MLLRTRDLRRAPSPAALADDDFPVRDIAIQRRYRNGAIPLVRQRRFAGAAHD